MTSEHLPAAEDDLLRTRRVVPSREFGDGLREHLRALEAGTHRPPYLWAIVAAHVVFGSLLLVIAAIAGL
jgi:hypothetical protein